MLGFQLMIVELDKMVLFCCLVCMKRLKIIHMNNFCLKKCEKRVTDARKGKMEWNVLNYLILFVSVPSTVKVTNVANYHITI